MTDLAVYAGLFLAAFAAATILPMQSEAALAGLLLTDALHVVFREVHALDIPGIGPAVPVLGSIDWRAAPLAATAMIAMLRFKVGMLPTLVGCAIVSVALKSIGG